VSAGQWRGIPVAIKTLIFQDGKGDHQTTLVASEAAIASNLVHRNIVATYSHDICNVVSETAHELGIFKFYLIQVRQIFLFLLVLFSFVMDSSFVPVQAKVLPQPGLPLPCESQCAELRSLHAAAGYCSTPAASVVQFSARRACKSQCDEQFVQCIASLGMRTMFI
jgi:hypothetical protein